MCDLKNRDELVTECDRLLMNDEDVYHFGASLKDLGQKWFAFSKMDKAAFELYGNLKRVMLDE